MANFKITFPSKNIVTSCTTITSTTLINSQYFVVDFLGTVAFQKQKFNHIKILYLHHKVDYFSNQLPEKNEATLITEYLKFITIHKQ